MPAKRGHDEIMDCSLGMNRSDWQKPKLRSKAGAEGMVLAPRTYDDGLRARLDGSFGPDCSGRFGRLI
jgi:hypothetical protein